MIKQLENCTEPKSNDSTTHFSVLEIDLATSRMSYKLFITASFTFKNQLRPHGHQFGYLHSGRNLHDTR